MEFESKINSILSKNELSKDEKEKYYIYFYDNIVGNIDNLKQLENIVNTILHTKFLHLLNNQDLKLVPKNLSILGLILYYPRRHFEKDPFLSYGLEAPSEEYTFYHFL